MSNCNYERGMIGMLLPNTRGKKRVVKTCENEGGGKRTNLVYSMVKAVSLIVSHTTRMPAWIGEMSSRNGEDEREVSLKGDILHTTNDDMYFAVTKRRSRHQDH